MNPKRWMVAVLLAGLAGAGCQTQRPAGSEAQAPGTPAPATPAPPGGRFQPPADGKLTPEQVKMYIAVGQRALAREERAPGAPPAPGPQEMAQRAVRIAAAGDSLAEQLGYDVEEYRWVRARVAEASPPAPGELTGPLAQIDAQARQSQERVLGRTEGGEASTPPVNEAARAHNRQVLEPFRSELAALNPAARPAGTGSPRS